MAAGGGLQCIKYLLFIFNFIFWLAGTGVLAVGLWLRFDAKTKEFFTAENGQTVFLTGVYILIVAGAVMMVVGFLGCCGAIKESAFMLGLFFMFLLVIFAAEVAAGIWGLSNKDKIVSDVQQFYTQTVENYKKSPDGPLKETLTAIHFSLQCCGPTGLATDGVSVTCPKQEGLANIITTGCSSVIQDMFNSRLHVIGGVGIGIGVIMVFGMIFSMLLCCAIRRTRDIV